MTDNITITSALRSHLQSLQKTKNTENIGNIAHKPLSNASAGDSINQIAQDFCEQTLGIQASSLTSHLEEISSSIKMLEQASGDISDLLGLITNAELVTLAAQNALETDENTDITKFDNTLKNAVENTKNLIQKNNYEQIAKDNRLCAKGAMLDNVSLASTSSINISIDIIRDILDEAKRLRTTIANDFKNVQTLENFTKETISALEAGQKKINITNMGEEGANLMALQTRMALGSSPSLSLASTSQKDVLRLF